MSLEEQIEHHFDKVKRGGEKSQSSRRKASKKRKLRFERRKAKEDPECDAHYRKYQGYEW